MCKDRLLHFLELLIGRGPRLSITEAKSSIAARIYLSNEVLLPYILDRA